MVQKRVPFTNNRLNVLERDASGFGLYNRFMRTKNILLIYQQHTALICFSFWNETPHIDVTLSGMSMGDVSSPQNRAIAYLLYPVPSHLRVNVSDS